MVTEEQIVYSIIETVKKGEVNQDNRVGERIVRAFLAKYRANLIRQYSMDGYVISDECYQFLYGLTFNLLSDNKFKPIVLTHTNFPKTIRLKDNFGVIFTKNEENIPIVNNEEFYLGMKNIINKKLPKAMIMNGNAYLYIGQLITTSCGTSPKNNDLVNDLYEDYNTLVPPQKIKFVSIDAKVILQNPDDDPDYVWTDAPYPLDAELIEKMTNDILRIEYNIILQVKNDKVTNGKDQPTE